MKRLAEALGIAALSALPAGAVLAISSVPSINPITSSIDVKDVIIAIINYILFIAGALAVLFLIIGGIRYIISAGNSDQIEAARHTIFNAIIGIVIILVALVIVNTISSLITAAAK